MRKYVTASRLVRAIDWFLDVVAAYGYKPWRTVGIGLGVILAFILLWALGMRGCAEPGCRDESVFVRTDVAGYTRLHDISEKEKQTYPDFNPVGFSFDVFIPLFNFGYQDTWGVKTDYEETYAIPPIPCWGRKDNGAPQAPLKCRNIARFTVPWGGILYILYVLEIFLGAVLTTIAIAGFTGLLRSRRNE